MLGALAGANPYTLSGGQQRRLSVATVLATSGFGPRSTADEVLAG